MLLVEEFAQFAKPDRCEEIIALLTNYNKLSEFIDATNKDDYETLFNLAFHYGLCDVIAFLYIHKNVAYDYSILSNAVTKIPGCEPEEEYATVSTGGLHIGLKFSIDDKFTARRNQCVNFLLGLKKYSKMESKQGKFTYRFNKRYTDNVDLCF